MLRSIKQLYGDALGASDGEIGTVKDFYFDDGDWVVRYLVADTGPWLAKRQVLISPRCLGPLDQPQKTLRVKLTRKQIESSPAIETHKPVSRQFEEEYHRYYGWPSYWEGNEVSGAIGFPLLEIPPINPEEPEVTASKKKRRRDEAHLRSARAVNGYHVQTAEGIIGHVCDFMINVDDWAIVQLVIKTGHRFSGADVLFPTKNVTKISYEESTIYLDATGNAAEHHMLPHAI